MEHRFSFQKLNDRDPYGNSGFSLLEVILAMTILAIITIPLMNYFTNSMKNSARMARHQKATLTAQEITEELKAVDKLIQRTEVFNGGIEYFEYQVPYLTEKLGFTAVDEDDFDKTNGTGRIVFSGKKGDFDVEVTLSTDVSANTVDRALVYGIDDATDMLIIEQDQMNEALVYYTAAHTASCTGHTGEDTSCQSYIKDHLVRNICIDISYDGSTYMVQAYYKYTKTDDSSPFKSSYLLDARVTSLKNIYLLYDRMERSFEDTVNVTLNDFSPESSGFPQIDLYLLCQNLPAGASSTYDLSITNQSSNLKYHANIRTNDNTDVDLEPMTQSGSPIRMVWIETKVYEQGMEDSEEEPLATMSTTKGE